MLLLISHVLSVRKTFLLCLRWDVTAIVHESALLHPNCDCEFGASFLWAFDFLPRGQFPGRRFTWFFLGPKSSENSLQISNYQFLPHKLSFAILSPIICHIKCSNWYIEQAKKHPVNCERILHIHDYSYLLLTKTNKQTHTHICNRYSVKKIQSNYAITTSTQLKPNRYI